ncbi:aminotransferase class V-fold PLP-dependent enzyme [Saprospiraceae bacterium]|jgi:cysteine desulfurase/selenocysteine lyase|nr:aminotransferase class V-fold PLP-dependent enzyme [Saprospiraceae bacterium]MDB4539740.1 aminotransferase class V-fold PLP-dependent enzyme [Saprospiraceae bacterium]MDG1433984.1 aminotransferase class V-fold PLP-dependent enzyme [Saprospiraceae bacterium]
MSLDIEKLRADTPGTQAVIHFNNAGCSLPVKETIDIITEYLQLEATLGGYEVKNKYENIINDFYSEAAELINAGKDEIAIVSNASDGVNKILHSIQWKAGDVLLTTEVEYGNCYLNYLKLKEEKGIIVKIVPSDHDGNILLKKMEEMISSKVKLIAVTHIPTNSGLIMPAEKIGNIAKKHNILFLLDACQSVGHIPVDVKKIQCDFLSTTSRKYLRGPRGMGFIYARKEILEKLKPSTLDMVTAHWKDADNYALDCNIKIFEQWEKSYALLLGFSKALSYLNNLGVENTWKRIQYLSTYLRSQLEQTGGIEVTDIGKEQCGIVTFSVAGIDSEKLVNALLKHGINLSTSLRFSTVLDMDKRGLTGVCRASIHYFNTKEEIDILVEKVEQFFEFVMSKK